MFSVKCRLQTLRQIANNIKPTSSAQKELMFKCLNNFSMSFACGMKQDIEQLPKPFPRTGQLVKGLTVEQQIDKSTNGILPEHESVLARRILTPNDREIMTVFSDVIHELTGIARKYQTLPDAVEWFRRALEYNIGGNKTRGILTVSTFKYLTKDKEQTPENVKLALYLGWCVELLESYLILDDIMDAGIMRYSKPCWHVLDDVGSISVNDAIMIQNAIAVLLKQHFSHLDCYVNLIELFDEIAFLSMCGELTDMLISKKDITSFTMDYYDSLTASKAASCAFYLPIAAGMYLAGVKDEQIFHETMLILNKMGKLVQAQNDFRDCFSTPEITGKIGTDIQEKKCSWLLVTALLRANKEQKVILAECYGQADPVKVQRVKDIYIELELPRLYDEFMGMSHNNIINDIQKASPGVPRTILMEALDKFFDFNVKGHVSGKSLNTVF